MWRYILRRLLMLIPVLFGISIFVFLLMYFTPGDPAVLMLGEGAPPEQLEALREAMGLNDPFYVQYYRWLRNAVRGDLGRSLRSKKLVTEEILDRLPATTELAVAAVAFAVIVGVPVGILSATKPNSWFDNLAMVAALTGVGMPVFWQGIMLILIFSVHLRWLPSSGRMGGLEYLILPAITLGTASTASIARLTRSAMLEVLQQDYIRTARSKGLPRRMVTFRHALRNALIPVVTMIGLQFGGLMSGAVLTETIFAWPGIGRMIVDAINNKDFPLVQGTIMTFALMYALVNLIIDVTYALLDPRLRLVYE
ncbi:MAG: nickel ABC transporter permease [Limnochordia bacterium]|nr:ABC transporter permease [Limnochordia bacterium]MDI9465493.1 ABC transporter permease [Bacillota bacterium]NLO96130.1 ABC transporter permease [Bacillota bacterium]HOB41246.1 ABC transporter permease [Limnochordia bacterium]HOK32599.1 ABC transporter permease [Limnochordia bacterium]